MNYVKPCAMSYGKFLLKVWKEGRKEQSAEGAEAESCSGMLIQDMPDESREIKTKKLPFCFVLFSLIRTFARNNKLTTTWNKFSVTLSVSERRS